MTSRPLNVGGTFIFNSGALFFGSYSYRHRQLDPWLQYPLFMSMNSHSLIPTLFYAISGQTIGTTWDHPNPMCIEWPPGNHHLLERIEQLLGVGRLISNMVSSSTVEAELLLSLVASKMAAFGSLKIVSFNLLSQYLLFRLALQSYYRHYSFAQSLRYSTG